MDLFVLENKKGGDLDIEQKRKKQYMEVKFAQKSRILPITIAFGISNTRETGRREVGKGSRKC